MGTLKRNSIQGTTAVEGKFNFIRDFILSPVPETKPLGNSGTASDPYGMSDYVNGRLETLGSSKTVLLHQDSLTLNPDKPDGTYKDPLFPEIKFSGNWAKSNATSFGVRPNDLIFYANESGSFIEFTFYGKNIYGLLVGNSSSTTTLQVTIDGSGHTAIDTSAADLSAGSTQRRKLNSSSLTEGLHHVKLALNENKFLYIEGFTIDNNPAGSLDILKGDGYINGFLSQLSSSTIDIPAAISTNLGRSDTVSLGSNGTITVTDGTPIAASSENYGSDTDHSNEELLCEIPISEFIGQNGSSFTWKPAYIKEIDEWMELWSDKTITNVVTTGWLLDSGGRINIWAGTSGNNSDVNLYMIKPLGVTGVDVESYAATTNNSAMSLYVDNTVTARKSDIDASAGLNNKFTLPLFSEVQSGCSNVRLKITNNSGTYDAFQISHVKLYIPKRAALPANSVKSGTNIQLKSYVNNDNSPIDTGVRFIHALHGAKFVDGTTGAWGISMPDSPYLGGSVFYTSTDPNTDTDTECVIEFTGNGFEIIGKFGTNQGIQDIQLDSGAGFTALTTSNFPGVTLSKDGITYDNTNGRADCYATPDAPNKSVVKCTGLSYGNYKVKIKSSGTKKTESSAYGIHVVGINIHGQYNKQIDDRVFNPLGQDQDVELLKVQKQDKDSALDTVIDESLIESGHLVWGIIKPNVDLSANKAYRSVNFRTTKKVVPILIHTVASSGGDFSAITVTAVSKTEFFERLDLSTGTNYDASYQGIYTAIC